MPRAQITRFVLAGLLAWLTSLEPAHAAGTPLSLAEALRLAVARSPQLAAQRALAEGASVGSLAAGALPNPKLFGMAENVPIDTADAWTLQDPHTMLKLGVSQDFPGGDKRKLRVKRAEQDAQREAALLEVQIATVQREAAMAWVARRFADEALASVAAQIAEADLAVTTTAAAYRAGRAPHSELVSAQSAVIALKNRRTDVGVQVKRAQIALSRFIGADADRPLGDSPDLTRLPASVADLVDEDDLPEVRAARAQEAVAATEAELARAEKAPDWGIEFSYGYRGRAPTLAPQPFHATEPGAKYSDMVTLKVTIDLPWFTSSFIDARQSLRLKELDAARALREEAMRRQSAEVRGMIAEWESARMQAARIRDELVPLMIERRETALAAYRGGTGTLDAVLDARRAELEARLAVIEKEQAAAKAWAWLAFVFPIAEKS